VTVVFEEGTDVYHDRQLLAEKLAGVSSRLPLGVHPPTMSALTASTMDLLKIGLLSDRLSPMALRTFADWTLRPRLLAVAGVAQVSVFGGEVRQLQIQVQPDRLLGHGLALTDVLAAARASTGIVGAGFIDTPNQRIVLETQGQAIDPGVLAQVEVARRNGLSVRLADVARVVEAGAPRFGEASIQGRPGVLLTMLSQYGANTLEVTQAVERALDDMRPVFEQQGVTLYPRLHRPATFMETALGNLRVSLLLGGVLVALVLLAFLGHTRTALISLTAIPLSLLSAVIVLTRLGFTLNTMTLGGLAIAVGEVVDDGIVDVENIVRRLRENEHLGRPRSPFRVVLEASLEVRSAVVFASLVVVTVFLPVLMLTGLQGSFFAPLALAYVLAVLASLAVALTVTPALSLAVFSRGVRADAEPRLQRWIKRDYRRWLARVAAQPRRVMAAVALLCCAALAVLPFFGGEFLPPFREGHFVLQVSAAPGTSLDEMQRLGAAISEALLRMPTIATVAQQIGRAEQGEDTWGPHRSEFHVELKPNAKVDQNVAQEALRGILEHYPGIQSEVVTFLGDRISESLSGETAQVAIKVFGDDLDALDATGDKVVAALGKVKGIVDLQFKRQNGTPALVIELSPQALAATGLKVQDVLDTIETAYAGARVGQTFRGTRTVDVDVLLPEAARHQPAQLARLMIASPSGPVPLSQVARTDVSEDRYSIEHDGGQRRISVTFNVRGASLQGVVQEAQRAITRSVALPTGVYLEFTGTAAAEQQTRNELLLYSGLALALILVILFVSFHWRINTWLVLANLPFSLIGSVVAIAVTGLGTSLGTVVGLVTVFGVSARNSILQLAHYEHLVEVEGEAWTPRLVLRGANERLIPILMTAAVTALGLAPLAFGLNRPGQEIEGPMAVTVLGGLISSTLLNLLVLPALTQRYVRVTTPARVASTA
jgi:CzcA family heavy metal efflux pump